MLPEEEIYPDLIIGGAYYPEVPKMFMTSGLELHEYHYVTPTVLTIEENGSYDVSDYKDILVEVEGGVTPPNLQNKFAALSTSLQTVTADEGYDGMAEVYIQPVNATNLNALNSNFKADNIKSGVSMFGLTGTYEGSGGGGGWNLLGTYEIGDVNCTSTTAVALNVQATFYNVPSYDLYFVVCKRDSMANGYHYVTITPAYGYNTTDTSANLQAGTITTRLTKYGTGTNTLGSRTGNYGVYANAITKTTTSTTLTAPIYARYSSTYTKTINGHYTALLYGINIFNF